MPPVGASKAKVSLSATSSSGRRIRFRDGLGLIGVAESSVFEAVVHTRTRVRYYLLHDSSFHISGHDSDQRLDASGARESVLRIIDRWGRYRSRPWSLGRLQRRLSKLPPVVGGNTPSVWDLWRSGRLAMPARDWVQRRRRHKDAGQYRGDVYSPRRLPILCLRQFPASVA